MPGKEAAINVLWVGPPKSLLGSATLESDAKSTIDLAAKTTNPINFWCLDAHTAHYKKLFEESDVKVNVQSIDKYISEVERLSDKFGSAATKMQEVKKTLLQPPRDKIADRVSFKDAFSLFILATSGGYTFDSNVRLNIGSDATFTFPTYESERLPYQVGGEVWLMYATPQSAAFNQALDSYLSEWGNIQDALEEEPNSPEKIYEFHSSMTNSITDAVAPIAETLLDEDDNFSWKFSVTMHDESADTSGRATLPALPIEKEYGNSHKPWHAARKIVDKEYAQVLDGKINLPPKLLEAVRDLKEMGNQDGENPAWLSYCHILTYFSLRCIQKIDSNEAMLSQLSTSSKSTINDFDRAKAEVLQNLTEVLTDIIQHSSVDNPPTRDQKDAVKRVCQNGLDKLKKVMDEPLKSKISAYKSTLSVSQGTSKDAANDEAEEDNDSATYC